MRVRAIAAWFGYGDGPPPEPRATGDWHDPPWAHPASRLAAIVGASLIFISLFLDWYEASPQDGIDEVVATASAWQLFSTIDIALAGLALLIAILASVTLRAGRLRLFVVDELRRWATENARVVMHERND